METEYNRTQWELMEERCILVDDKDNQIGSDSKKNCHLRNATDGSTKCHRAFSVFLFNSDGKLLLQCRSAEKITFPLYWANTCCSHPLDITGETDIENDIGVKRAAIRKLNHELGISTSSLSVDDFTNVLTVKYNAPSDEKWGENEIDHILLIQKDVELNVNLEEVKEVKYVSYEEAVQVYNAGESISS
ncbi:isopentenyl-diphosphate delta-isomerase [Blastocystis sp. subtype 4]|uniref:isopentenyl-diphosphate delta-isomerase n=1 Tax=Blastocystis sp. subtype 4 TaxID=944170 RepID=UPI0007118D24|nr:isopentenyl-diphosphate delta-isomerase [Blastocystis sp. subtype 4]KNB45832.1 isopentenyl-diphosphate delta-isomerase [Blastocystis sp. subtype 4]|eukprot:XP_014529270.1 isopentenyl-diphosphate delta-isomerase [Blastocystis sp. subtype 4]